jgi:hypothetical protein
MILTPADLVLLTGRTRHSAQRRVLDALAVPYRCRPDGSIVVMQEDVRRESTPKEGSRSPALRLQPPRRTVVREAREVDAAGAG